VNIFETKRKKHPETPAKSKALVVMSASNYGIFLPVEGPNAPFPQSVVF
jgi:hypothetical protein